MSARPTFAPLPPGARDLLPPVLRRRRRLQERALAVFEAWGYAPVATPAVEYFEVFGRGLTEAERQRCLRFIAPGAEEVEVLRSDVTPQIARLVAQRLRDRLEAGELVRLAYAADVIRKPAAADEAAEEHQVGVELVGDPTAAADAELVALAHAALDRCGVEGAVFDLAHVGVARSVLDDLEVSDALRRPLITRLARKDLAGLDAILGEAGASDAARAELRALASLHGSVDVIDRARAVLGAAARRSLDEIAAVVDAVRGVAPAVLERLSVDLGEIRGHDYYSGLRLRVWAPGSPRPLLRGGRYDGLLRRYGVDAPATGLVIGVDDIERLTSEAELPPSPPPTRIVVLSEGTGEGHAEARRRGDLEAAAARAAGLRAWVEPGLDLAAARALAERVGAAEVVAIENTRQGAAHQRWRRGASGWERLADGGESES